MIYSVEFTPEADADLARLHPMVASRLLDELEAALATQDPYDALIPWFMLYRPAGWYFKRYIEVEGQNLVVFSGVDANPQLKLITILYIASAPRHAG